MHTVLQCRRHGAGRNREEGSDNGSRETQGSFWAHRKRTQGMRDVLGYLLIVLVENRDNLRTILSNVDDEFWIKVIGAITVWLNTNENFD